MAKKFGELTNEEKKELFGAWVDGKQIEFMKAGTDGEWIKTGHPLWTPDISYRVAGQGDMNIPWDIIRPELKWAAKNADGMVYFYTNEPFYMFYETDDGEIIVGDPFWKMTYGGASDCAGMRMSEAIGGDCHWADSLTKRD